MGKRPWRERFAPGRKLTVFTLIVLPILVVLGFWQLDRAAQKRALETDYLAQLTQLPQRPTAGAAYADFKRMRLQGHYGEQIFLLDNQVSAGEPGYWVLQRFTDNSGSAFLVNRGFVPAPVLRQDLPSVATPAGELTIVGMAWPDTGLPPLLDDDPWPVGWPVRVQRRDIKRMAAQADTQPLEIRLEAGQPSVFQAAPFAVLLSEDIHLGYAATWFGLAGVLLVGFILHGANSGRAHSKEKHTE